MKFNRNKNNLTINLLLIIQSLKNKRNMLIKLLMLRPLKLIKDIIYN